MSCCTLAPYNKTSENASVFIEFNFVCVIHMSVLKNWMEYKSENMMSVHQVKFKDYKIMVHILQDLLLLIEISETVS